MKKFARTFRGAILGFTALTVISSPAIAASSDWFKTDGAKIRIVTLPSPDGKVINAGLQFKLEDGWKTYWRAPGASGLPPEINFLGSTNVASTKMQFPIPTAFSDGTGLSAGYKHEVTFPITIEPLFAGRTVKLNVNGFVGICGEICIPVQFKLAVEENGKGISNADVASTLFKASSNLSENHHEEFQVTNTELIAGEKPSLKVTAQIPHSAKEATLFVEGPSNWYLMPAKSQRIANGIAEFDLSLSSMPKNAKVAGTKVTFSVVADGKGIEQPYVLSE